MWPCGFTWISSHLYVLLLTVVHKLVGKNIIWLVAVLILVVSSLIVPLVLWIAVAVQVALAGECLKYTHE